MKLSKHDQRYVDIALKRSREVVAALDLAQQTGRVNLLEKAKALAFLLHEFNCFRNHTDGCSWEYEESSRDPWLGDVHKRWLRIACKYVGALFPSYIQELESSDLKLASDMDDEE